MSIETKLQKLVDIKKDIKSALEEKNRTPTNEFSTYANEIRGLITDGIKPEGEKEITSTQPVDVTTYATAKVVDSNLVAENIAKDKTILGITGTFEGGITPTGELSITENGTYDVTQYASANVNVAGSGGGESATIVTPEGYTNTPIAMYDKEEEIGTYYFNTSLSVGEINTLLQGLIIRDTIGLVYVNEAIAITYEPTMDVYLIANILSEDSVIYYASKTLSKEEAGLEIIEGWQTDKVELNITASVNSTVNEMLEENKFILNQLFSNGTPFGKTEAVIEKTLSGVYDASPITITDSGVIDLKPLIDEKKIPLALNIVINGLSALIDGSITKIESNAQSVRQSAFSSIGSLESVKLPYATYIWNSAFYQCGGLINVEIPLVTALNGAAFQKCSKLENISLPSVTRIDQDVFQDCVKLTSIYLPKIVTLNSNSFKNCYSLKCIILNSTEYVSGISIGNIFVNCYHLSGTVNSTYNPSGNKDCFFYVPDNLVDTYKGGNGWASYANQIKGISELPIEYKELYGIQS